MFLRKDFARKKKHKKVPKAQKAQKRNQAKAQNVKVSEQR